MSFTGVLVSHKSKKVLVVSLLFYQLNRDDLGFHLLAACVDDKS